MFELTYHEKLVISNPNRAISGVNTIAYDSVLKNDFTKSETVNGENNVLALTERNENPFKVATTQKQLHIILRHSRSHDPEN